MLTWRGLGDAQCDDKGISADELSMGLGSAPGRALLAKGAPPALTRRTPPDGQCARNHRVGNRTPQHGKTDRWIPDISQNGKREPSENEQPTTHWCKTAILSIPR